MNEINKKGLSTTLLCCLIWGLLPLYWALLNQVSSFSVLSHRIIWSGFWMFFLVIATGRQQLRMDIQLLRTHLTQLSLLLLAAILISINWFTYIWAVIYNTCLLPWASSWPSSTLVKALVQPNS